MITRKLELYFKDIVCGRRRGLLPFLIKAFLLPLSWLYGLVVNCRNKLYEMGWMRRYVPPVPLVISIGNIVVGGTGKTPVTLLLGGAFYGKFNTAILTRGYRSKAGKLNTPVILCEGHGPTFPASYCGDEPYLLAKRLPKGIVIVGGDRKKASFLAGKMGAQVILLDDGMQHRQLARDFDVVVVDAGDPFGQGYLLPRGFLREDIHSLVRANLIIINNINDPEQFSSIKLLLKPYTSAPVVGTNGFVAAIRDLKGQAIEIPAERKVGMFCGIAHPEYFKRTLEKEGFQVVSEFILSDHDKISAKELEKFAQSSLKNGAKWLICTEKDRVKLNDSLIFALPIIWVQLELQQVAGDEEWHEFLKQAEAKIT